MITLTILIIAFIKVTSDAGVDFMPLDFEKQVKKIVKDKERKNLILHYTGVVKVNNKEFRKSTKGDVKLFWDITQNYKTTEEELYDVLLKNSQQKNEIQINNLANELEIKKLLNTSEWDLMLAANDKAFTKVEKSRSKALASFQKMKDQFRIMVQTSILDAEKLAAVEGLIDVHSKDKMEILNALGGINYSENEVLRNLRSSKEEHEEVVRSMDEHVEQYYALYIDTRMKIVSMTTEKEWNNIVKEFNKMYK